jgi:hypothetical protein
MQATQKPLTWTQCIDKSLSTSESKEYDCKIDCFLSNIIEGETNWHAYTAHISNREILLYCDKGTLSYVVDTYGDRRVVELIDWERI